MFNNANSTITQFHIYIISFSMIWNLLNLSLLVLSHSTIQDHHQYNHPPQPSSSSSLSLSSSSSTLGSGPIQYMWPLSLTFLIIWWLHGQTHSPQHLMYPTSIRHIAQRCHQCNAMSGIWGGPNSWRVECATKMSYDPSYPILESIWEMVDCAKKYIYIREHSKEIQGYFRTKCFISGTGGCGSES